MMVTLLCTRCRAPLAPRARFCHECGEPTEDGTRARGAAPAIRNAEGIAEDDTGAPEQGERRFATCLFADIVDYTAMCGASDAELIQAMLKTFFAMGDAAIAGAGGHVVDHAGDAIVAVFGAPMAYGDDPLRAVRVAQTLHDRAARLYDPGGRPLRLRIGIASGEVVASTLQVGALPKYTVTGDTVNLSARLCSAALPADTLLSDSCYLAVCGSVQCARLDPLNLKGFGRPQLAWRVEQLLEEGPLRSPFVGRTAEMSQFAQILASPAIDGLTRTLRIEGEAGIGKSRLLRECCTLAQGSGFSIHTARFADLASALPGAPIATLLRGFAPATMRDDPGACADWLLAQMPDCANEGGPAFTSVHAPADLPVRNGLIRVALGTPLSASVRATLGAMSYEWRQEATAQVIAAVIRSQAQQQPRLIALEDIHWAPASVAALLQRIASFLADVPCVLVMTSRDSLPVRAEEAVRGTARASGNGPQVIRLSPLSDEAARGMAREHPPDDTRLNACLARAQGNPLFLESLLRAMAAGHSAEIPGTVHSAVSSQVDRLDPPLRALLQVASIFGAHVDLDSLRCVSEPRPPARNLDNDIEALCRARLMQRDGPVLTFAHSLVQEAVYASLLHSRRRELHRRAAALANDHQLSMRAEHLLRADDPQAAQAFADAARRALADHQPDTAVSLAERGSRARPAASVRATLEILRGDALRAMGRSAQALDVLHSAMAMELDADQMSLARLACVEVYRTTADYEQAHRMLDEAEREARERGSGGELARIYNLRGNLLFGQGRGEECLAAHELAMAAARLAGDPMETMRAHSGLGDAYYASGQITSAEHHFATALEMSRADGSDPRLALATAGMLGRCWGWALRLQEARTLIESAMADPAAAGYVQGQIVVRQMLSGILMLMGDGREGLRVSQEALALARAIGTRRFEVLVLRNTARHLADLGDREQALTAARESLRLSRTSGFEFVGPAVLGTLARITEDRSERSESLREGESHLNDRSPAHSHIGFRTEAIDACLEAGEWAEALRHAELLETRFKPDVPIHLALVVRRARLLAEIGTAGTPISPSHTTMLEALAAEMESFGFRGLPLTTRTL